MIFTNKKYRVLVETEKNKYGRNGFIFNCYFSPSKSFDRWANSRSILFTIHNGRFSERGKKEYRFDKNEFEKWFDTEIKRVKKIINIIPIDYFNRGIEIKL